MSGNATVQQLRDAAQVARDVRSLSRSQWWPRQRIEAWQSQRLVRILEHAASQVPYYRALGLDGVADDAVRQLQRFPLLNKDIIQREGDGLLRAGADRNTLFSSRTSGSSGQPTTTWFDRDSWLLCKFALKIRRTLEGGSLFGERLMIFGEAADSARAAPEVSHRGLYREMRLSVFLPPEEQHEALCGFRPTMIYGAPSALRALCDHAAERGLVLPHVRTVFLSSELVSTALRERLKRELQCRVMGVYGSTEFKEVAHECRHERYHLNFESVFVENLDPEQPGGTPRLALTTLVNTAMPLIRFDIGDHARIVHGRCECGRESPWLTDIAGRQVEYVRLADGRLVSPYLLTTHIEMVPGLRQYQIVQRAGGALELRVVFIAGFAQQQQALARLRQVLEDLAGRGTPVRVNEVPFIRRTPAGKHLVVTRED